MIDKDDFSTINIRSARADDEAFIVSVIPRLVESDLPLGATQKK